jgi:hypothetical protein
MSDHTYAVTLVRIGLGLPVFEVGAYTYTGRGLPQVGDTISIRPVSASDDANSAEVQGYVTKINPLSDNPISVLETKSTGSEAGSVDDYVVEPAGGHDEPEWRSAAGL